MRNETSRIDRDAWKFADKTAMPRGLGSLIRLALFVVAIGLAGVLAFVALLHVAEVIP
jgi:hypothetical protein